MHFYFKWHEPKPYVTIGSVDGLFFKIDSFKHVKDPINSFKFKFKGLRKENLKILIFLIFEIEILSDFAVLHICCC